jgi:hypothetical protein
MGAEPVGVALMNPVARISRFYEDLFAAAFQHTQDVWYGDSDSAAQMIALCLAADMFCNITFPIIRVQLARHGPSHLTPIWPFALMGFTFLFHFIYFTGDERYAPMVERFERYGAIRQTVLRVIAWTYMIGTFAFVLVLMNWK